MRTIATFHREEVHTAVHKKSLKIGHKFKVSAKGPCKKRNANFARAALGHIPPCRPVLS